MKKPETVPPNMSYLESLRNQGHSVIDVLILTIGPDKAAVTVFLKGEDERKFHIEGKSSVLMAHFRQAVEFSGYGPRGLANLIHADVMERSRLEKCKAERFEILVSQECLERVGTHLKPWAYYGYKLFLWNQANAGITYMIRRTEDGQFPGRKRLK
jgi:hypothetical protein